MKSTLVLVAAALLASAAFGQSFEVDSKPYWNTVSVEIKAGSTYELSVPTGEKWTDWYIDCGPEGYERTFLHLFDGLKRMPHLPYFRLVCCYAPEESTCFDVGAGTTLQATMSTDALHCFANDVPHFYWNNKGSLQLDVSPASL
eukprot:CAMPEP_0196769776 /NCGR_PEP_ID=MMETSP1104-20130614/748_1 /TAXON_ID=33652 /ORGANISM="Cafeteria sp., Strain Caron Lab Isolate" /LENGTH=143 /DNA_ID=CAMNT_0042139879 /DNA_START=1 /DNA_END=432 /DNA_ORIENTATION=+